ncbi:MAG: GntR family transcriptional regulator [Betaproteobacteria bacterium]
MAGKAIPKAASKAALRAANATPRRTKAGLRTTGPRPQGRNRTGALIDALRERIARHEAPPGAKLGELELALEFGVPRTQVREAFSALEQRGLIERIPNRGAIVARLDPADLVHIYDTREVLEGLCVRLATQNVPNVSWQDLLTLFKGPMQTYVEKGDFDAFLEGYAQFRTRSIEATRNPLLTQMLDSIYEKTQVLIRRIIILPGRAQQGLREHVAVLEAMRRGKADLAESLRRENMRSAKDWVLRYQKYVL